MEFAIEPAGGNRIQVKPCVGEAAVHTRWAQFHAAETFVQYQSDVITARSVPINTGWRMITVMAMLAQLSNQLVNLVTGFPVQRQQAVSNGLFGVRNFVVENIQSTVVLTVYKRMSQPFQFENIAEKLCLHLTKYALTHQLLIVTDWR